MLEPGEYEYPEVDKESSRGEEDGEEDGDEDDGASPLFAASTEGRTGAVRKILLGIGVNVNVRTVAARPRWTRPWPMATSSSPACSEPQMW